MASRSYHLLIHVVVPWVSQFQAVYAAVNMRPKVSDVRMSGMGNEPEDGIARQVQLHQMEHSLLDPQEDPVRLLAGYDQYLVVEVLVDDVSDLIAIGVRVVLRDRDPIQPSGLDRRYDSPHDVRGGIGTSRCFAAVGVEIEFQAPRVLSGCRAELGKSGDTT